MTGILARIRELENKTVYTVFPGEWSNRPYTAGYVKSPKTGKWGAYIRTQKTLEYYTAETEQDAAKMLVLFLALAGGEI